MPTHFEDQPWYPKWKEAVERVVEARMARDGTQPGTPEREAAATRTQLNSRGGPRSPPPRNERKAANAAS